MRASTIARGPRWRVAALTTLLFATTFAVDAAPVSLPGPLDTARGPQPVEAGYCASNAAFSGRLTGSSSSTTALARTTSPTIYSYISNVQAAWSCTSYFRYSGVAWNSTATLGAFRWGNLINSTGVACNYVVGSTDYIKANSTTDCPDSDAEYAHSTAFLDEGVYQRDLAHDSVGDFSFIHSDCVSYYGANPTATSQNFATTNIYNRPNAGSGNPGANCDPIDTDDTNTTQTITYDSTPPTVAISAPGAGPLYYRDYTTYTPTFNPSDNVAGFGGSYLWYFQRQTAPISGVAACSATWTPENTVSGTTQGSQNGASVTLANGLCYRWRLTGTDQNGNGPISTYSGAMLIDRTAPTIDFTTPNENTTTTQNTTSYSVAWTETETQSGVASRSLQRQRVAATSSACPGTFTNDGSAYTGGSASAQTLTTGYCYQWIQSITDAAGNTGTKTSGKVYVDAASPATNFSTPNAGTTTLQATTTYSVAWTETAGSGSITSRSLQRQRGAIVTPSTCAGVTWANDGSASTSVSPVSVTGLLGGYCYRWAQTLTNSGGKSSTTYSGAVLVDTTAPTATIGTTTPSANAPLAGPVTIAGTATDAHSFKDYLLEYGAGAAPASWTSVGTFTAQVPSGTLGVWDPGTLSGVYTIRLTVRQNASTTVTTATRTVVLENSRRGEEPFYTRVPFDLGGGWSLDVGVHNGEARLSRDLFSIPSYGPSQALSLSYSSLETGTAGRFGTGWSSNLTQYLSFDATDVVVWHRADGGRVPFGKVAGVWTALAGHFEILSVSGTEYTITAKDQSRLVFADAAGSGRLKRIENRFGKALTITWSANAATVVDASGRGPASGQSNNVIYDAANGRVTSFIDHAGRSWSFGYTGTALTSITDPASKVTTLGYTGGSLTTVTRTRTKAAGGTDTITWTVGYTSGKATAVTDPVAATVASTFTYSAGSTDVGLLKETAGPVRNTWTYAYDQLGRVSSMDDPEGSTTTWDYAPDWSRLDVANPIGTGTEQATTSYTYDTKGNVLTETVPIDASRSVVTVNTYNATNDLLTRTDSDSDSATRTVTRYIYDGSGHLTSTNVDCTTSGTTPPSQGQGGTCTGNGTQDASTNLITSYTYTANDQVLDETDPLGRVTRHGYDSFGNETGLTSNFISGQSATHERNVNRTGFRGDSRHRIQAAGSTARWR